MFPENLLHSYKYKGRKEWATHTHTHTNKHTHSKTKCSNVVNYEVRYACLNHL